MANIPFTHKECYEITRDPRREGLSATKKEAKKAAKGLGYTDDVLDAISNAKTESEVTMIMRNARKRG